MMLFFLLISLFFIVNLNLQVNTLKDSQSTRSYAINSITHRFYRIIQRNKNVLSNSSNLIKSFQTDNKISCLLACNKILICNIVIYSSNGFCALYKKEAFNELIDFIAGQKTIVFQSQTEISSLMEGLVNYWPIVNDLRDYIGSSDMTTGPLDAGETIGFTKDRFNNPNGAIYTNPGYFIIPPGFYFKTTYIFLIWVKVLAFSIYGRIIDCGNGPQSDNIIVSFSNQYSHIPFTEIFRGNEFQSIVEGVNSFPLNTWYHIAAVYDGHNLMLYTNGNLVANSTTGAPLIVKRSNCYIGRSNWHFSDGDPDSNACYEKLNHHIMIYNKALTTDEVRKCMNTNFN